MGGILELIKLIYGSKALSKVLGTRTNVIRLPDNELKQYTKSDLNIEAASDKLAQKAKADMKELLADYPRMNDAEKLIFEGNLRRLGNKLGVTEKGPAADVLEFGTGEKVSPEGIMSLTEKAGQKNPPTTLMGKLESRVKQLEASGEDLSKMKGQTYDEFMNDITQGQRTMIRLEDEGLVRATAREIIDKDIKSKKIKLPKEVEADFKQGGGEPIDVFRQFYGEDALEQLNSMVPDFRRMYSPREAAEAATKKFNFEFKADRPPGSISIEDAKKAEQEFGINKPKQTEVTDITAKVYRNADPDELIDEYNKNLNLLSQVDEDGGTLIGYEQFKKLQNRNTEIEKILDSINIKSADSPEGKKITEALIGKPKASVTELVTAEKIISDMKKMDPMDAMKEANKVLKKEGKYKNLQEKDVERIMEDTNDFIFGRDIPEDPEGFAKGGRVGMAGGGILKLAMKFFNDNNPVSAYKKYLKYVKETAQKDPAKLAPEMGGIVVGSELIHRGLRRKLKEAKEKNDTDDSEDTTTEDRTEKAGGGVSQGLDYLMGIERRGYAVGGTGPNTTTYLTPTEFFETSATRKEYAKILDELDEIVYSGQYANPEKAEYIKNLEDKKNKLYAQSWDEYYKSEEDALNSQTTPTMGESGGIITDGGLKYRINADGSKTLLESVPGPNGIEFKLVTGQFSGKPVYKAFYPEDYDFSKFGAIGGSTASEFDPEYFFKNIMAPEGTNAQTTPTVEEQMVSPDDAMNQYDIETPETDFFSGPAYDKYSKERTDAYANSPSKFDYDIRANEAAGQFIQDKITGSLGDNKLGRFVGDAAALASVPLAIFGSPFHEAAQVVAENRMEPGSGIKGFAKAFMNEQPISTAINRGAGVLQSTALGKGIYNLGGDLYNLKEKLQQRAPANIVENIDTAVSSLNPYQQQRYVNFAIENPDRAIQAAQRDQDFRTAIERRDQKQKGGLSYLLGM
jgi:hypothetical protein